MSTRSITRLFEGQRPSLVVVRGEREAASITAVLFQETGVMLVGIAYAVVAAELLVRLVIGI